MSFKMKACQFTRNAYTMNLTDRVDGRHMVKYAKPSLIRSIFLAIGVF